MKKIYFIKRSTLPILWLMGSVVFGQVQFKKLTEFGTPILDINNHGQGIHGNGYYDFETNTSSFTEDNVIETNAINNAGQVIGFIDDGAGSYLPALKTGGVWTALINIDHSISYTFYGLSENGKYAIGQTADDQTFEYWPFIYNIETQTMTVISSDLYEYGAGYAINNEGVGVGWLDDLPIGTVRMPAYFTEDGNITLIQTDYGEAHYINDNHQIVGNYGEHAFIFNKETNDFQSFSPIGDYDNAAFTGISDNGIAVGYSEIFVEGEGFMRFPIIYHNELGNEIQMLADVLAGFDIDVTDLDGQGGRISSDGNYIGGWTSGPAFFAMGWAVNFDNQLLGTKDLFAHSFSYYPNPVTDVLNIATQKTIQNVAIFNLAGQQLVDQSKLSNGQIDVSSLSSGVYACKVTLEGGEVKSFKIVKK